MTKPITNRTLGIVFLFFAVFLFGYASQAQTLTLGSLYAQEGSEQLYIEEGASLKSTLEQVEKHYNVGLLYRSNIVEGVTIKHSANLSLNVEEALSFLLKGTDLRFKALNPKTYGIYKSAMIIHQAVEADIQQSVWGTVTDVQTGEVLPGVNVIAAGSEEETGSVIGTSTDANGYYELQIPDNLNTLVFTSIGYERLEVEIDGRTEINVELMSDVQMLEDLVVIGYGEQRRADLTGSITSVRASDFEKQNVTSLEQGLQGRSPGVYVVQANAAPGGQTRIRIRGDNSIMGSNEPLYVVDGVPIMSDNTHGRSMLSTFNPDDIESMEVLKDASATAIYGARGSNGVVLITTKEGVSDRHSIDYESSVSIQQITKTIDLLDGRQLAELANERAINDGNVIPYPDLDALPDIETDWQNEIFRTAPMHNHTLRFSGGTNDTRYVISTNYLDQQGIIKNTDFSRGSFRANLDQTISPSFSISSRLYLTRSVNHESSTHQAEGIMIHALGAPPFLPVRDEDGNYTRIIENSPFSPPTMVNPVALMNEQMDKLRSDRVIGSVLGKYRFNEWLSANVRLGADLLDNKRDQYTSRLVHQRSNTASQERLKTLSYVSENTLNINKDFGSDHRLNGIASFTLENQQTDFISASATGFQSDIFETSNMSSADSFTAPNTGLTEWTLISFLGRINYSYLDRYIFTFTGRNDGSSRFSERNQWAFFPSAAIAWRIVEEDFIRQNFDTVSDLKLRISWGLSGNQAISPYQTLQRIVPVELSMGNNRLIGFSATDLSNPNLKWETTEQYNVGLDLSLFNHRLRFTTDIYHKETRNLLARVDLPRSSGFQSSIQNIGSIQNRGVELALGTDILSGTTLHWDIEMNVSANRNEVTKLAGGVDIIAPEMHLIGSAHILREGEPFSSFYGWVEDGLDEVGRIKYVDQNNDGVVNDQDRVILGNPHPDFYYGLTTNFRYRNFNLSASIQGVQGVDVFNANLERHGFPLNRGNNPIAAVQNRWTPDNPDPNAPFPRASQDINERPSDRWVEDASYIRLKNVHLSYEIPAEKIGLRSANVYLSGQNLITITNYSFFDPEVSSFGNNDLRVGVDMTPYPAARTFTLGIRLGI